MMTKRIATALVVLLALAAIVLTGCGPAAATGKTTLKIMAYGDNSTAEGKTAQALIDEFAAANPDIDVQSEILFDEAYHQKARARIASSDFPDVMYVWAGPRSNYFYDAGLNVDVRSMIDPAQYDVSKIQSMGPNGEIWYVPIGVSNVTSVLFANTELLGSLGLAEPASYEDLVKMVPVAKKAGVEVIAFAGAESWVWNSCLLSPLVGRYTATTFVSDAVAGRASFEDAGMVQAVAMIKKMVDDGVINANSVRVDYGTSVANFIGGKALFTLDGQWRAGAFEDPAFQAKVKMLPLPAFPGEKLAGSVSADISTGYALTKTATKDAKVQKAALDFINFFNNEKNVLQRWKDGAIAMPLLAKYEEPTDFNTIVKEKLRFYRALTTYTNVVDAFVPADPNNNLNANIQEMVLGTKTAEEVAKLLEADVAKVRK